MFARCLALAPMQSFLERNLFLQLLMNVPALAQQRDHCWRRPRRLFDDRLGFSLGPAAWKCELKDRSTGATR